MSWFNWFGNSDSDSDGEESKYDEDGRPLFKKLTPNPVQKYPSEYTVPPDFVPTKYIPRRKLAYVDNIDTSQIPDDTSQIPDDTSQIPDDTSQIPDDTSQIPDDTANYVTTNTTGVRYTDENTKPSTEPSAPPFNEMTSVNKKWWEKLPTPGNPTEEESTFYHPTQQNFDDDTRYLKETETEGGSKQKRKRKTHKRRLSRKRGAHKQRTSRKRGAHKQRTSRKRGTRKRRRQRK